MISRMGQLPLITLLRQEFDGYTWATFQRDMFAGITVGAVALPLALAFGVASGADAAAGLVTAIVAGFLIGSIGGASFQISGPTGAMSAILIVLAHRYGMQGIWTASVLAGVMLIVLGIFRFGRYISFIPSSVITGFTSGIAVIIAIGEIDHVLGITSPPAENALEKLMTYITSPPIPDVHAVALAGVVILIMLVMPRFTKTVPGSLVGLGVASLLAWGMGWHVPIIGDIPRTILLDQRLTWATIPWVHLKELFSSAVVIASLGAIESLLSGTVGANMTGTTFDSNQELIAQGIGNIAIPFFGGVPATAAIARSSVAIKSGGVTRLTSIVHALVLLVSVLFLAPYLSQVPLAALGGILLVTAWRMNEWEAIHFFLHKGMRHALLGMILTMVATVALDLTQAILIGIAISALVYLRQSSQSTSVTSAPIDRERLRSSGHQLDHIGINAHIYYLTGPVFFGSVHSVLEAFTASQEYETIIISMRGVPLVDATGVQAMLQIIEKHHRNGKDVCVSGVQPSVESIFRHAGIFERVGEQNVFWSADQAIRTLDMRQRAKQQHHDEPYELPFPTHVTVADVMTREVYSVEPTTPAQNIVMLLLDNALRWLPVVDAEQRVVGVISEGDLLRRDVIQLSLSMKQLLPLSERASAVLALESQHLTAADLATPTPITIHSTASLSDAAQLMVAHTLKRLPVVDATTMALVGVLTRSHVLGTVTDTEESYTTVTPTMQPNGHVPLVVGSVMERNVLVVTPTTPLTDVLEGVLRSPQRRAIVLDGTTLVGVITDGDVLKRAARLGKTTALRHLGALRHSDSDSNGHAHIIPSEVHIALAGSVAADVMTSRIRTVQATMTIMAAIQQLITYDVVGVPVVDEQQQFQGWVDRSALLFALVHATCDNTNSHLDAS